MSEEQMPTLPEPMIANGDTICEDCDGSGVCGEPMPQGEFQPPEFDNCPTCNGSGSWKVDFYSDDQMHAYARTYASQARAADLEVMRVAVEALEVATTPLARDRQEVLAAIARLRERLEAGQ